MDQSSPKAKAAKFYGWLGLIYGVLKQQNSSCKTESNCNLWVYNILLRHYSGVLFQCFTQPWLARDHFCDDFKFHITNFPFLSSNVQASPAHGVFISQLIRYARACSSYECFILRSTRLSNKLLNRDTSRNAENSYWRSFMVDTGILRNNTKLLYRECLMTICSLVKYNDNPPPIRLHTNPWPFYQTRPLTDLHVWEVSMEHSRRV